MEWERGGSLQKRFVNFVIPIFGEWMVKMVVNIPLRNYHEKVMSLWPKNIENSKPFVVCTGGEPMLQMDEKLVDSFHQIGFEIAVETNGTIRTASWN